MLARRGYTNSEMAELLGISRNAVRFHLKEIHSKLETGGERNRLVRGWQRAFGLLALPLAKTGATATAVALAVAIGAGAVVAYRVIPGRDALAAPERFEGAVIVDGVLQPPTIVEMTPEDGSIVSVASTASADSLRPAGVCVEVRFEETPGTGRWFRLFLDGVDVTASSVWFLPGVTGAKTGRLCYAPEEGLAIGSRTAEVLVRDPSDPRAALRESARWSFTVTP